MNILTLNAGSSSLKAALLNATNGAPLFEMTADRLLDRPVLQFSDGSTLELEGKGPERAIAVCLEALADKLKDFDIDGIAHRVVHGGDKFDRTVRLTKEVEATIESLAPLAPLHNPVNLKGIRVAKQVFSDVDHFAVFDTAFHQSLPSRAKHYALPKELVEKHNIRRYGFHGTSHKYVAATAATFLGAEPADLRIISCHLGNGCSVAAIEFGRSVETSMGMTPLEGLVMGTRSGDVDPGILSYLHRETGMDATELDRMLNRESGLLGLSGISNDMRTILDKSTGRTGG